MTSELLKAIREILRTHDERCPNTNGFYPCCLHDDLTNEMPEAVEVLRAEAKKYVNE